MNKLVFFFILVTVGVSQAQSVKTGKACTPEKLIQLQKVWEEMVAEGAARQMLHARVGFHVGECETYSLAQIAQRTHRQNAPPRFCGLALILSPDPQYAAKQASWILDNFGVQYETQNGLRMRLCGRLSTGAMRRPGVTVRN